MADLPQSTREEIMGAAAPLLGAIEIFHNQVLVATYMAGDKIETASGAVIYRPDSNAAEDQYQGKVGLVLKKGPMAFKNDRNVDFHDQDVNVEDWVVYRVQEAIGIDLRISPTAHIHCRLVQDIHIRGRVIDPAIIY